MNLTYYSLFWTDGGRAEESYVMVRLRLGEPMFTAERLDRSGAWFPSPILIDT